MQKSVSNLPTLRCDGRLRPPPYSVAGFMALSHKYSIFSKDNCPLFTEGFESLVIDISKSCLKWTQIFLTQIDPNIPFLIISSFSSSVFQTTSTINMATDPPPNKKRKYDLFNCIKEFQRILECPVCLLTPENPDNTHFCSNGHMVCGTCRDQITFCPICESGDLTGQNPLLKQILSKLPKLCPFEGCQAEPKDEDVDEHKKTCQYRLIDCISHSGHGCNEKLPFNCLTNHIFEKHKKQKMFPIGRGPNNLFLMNTEEFIFGNNIELISWLPHFFTFDGNTFMINCTKKNQLFHFRCFFYGTETDAKNYICEINSNGSEFPNYSIKLSGDVISVDIKKTEYEKGEYFDNFTISSTLARKLWNKNSKRITIQVNIRKL